VRVSAHDLSIERWISIREPSLKAEEIVVESQRPPGAPSQRRRGRCKGACRVARTDSSPCLDSISIHTNLSVNAGAPQPLRRDRIHPEPRTRAQGKLL
jgi:hypothetical protein